MTRKRDALVVVAILAVGVLVAGMPAGAAPARSATLNSEALEYEWSHGPVAVTTGVEVPGVFGTQLSDMCDDPGFPCDDTLFELTETGKLVISTVADEELPDGVRYRPDIDIYLYKSDASGTVGSQVGVSETPDRAEAITVKTAQPGFYLLRVAYWSGINVSYDGKATFTPPPPPPPVP